MDLWQEVLWSAIAYGVVLAVALVVAATLIWAKPSVKEKTWPLERLRNGSWSGLEVLLAFAVIKVAPAIVFGVLDELGFFDAVAEDPSRARKIIYAVPLYFFLTLAIIVGLLFGVSGTRPNHFGLTPARWQHCVVQGLGGFALVTPVVLAIYLVTVTYLPSVPHFLETMKDELWPAEFWLVFFMSCVAAPILEEVLFRGLLQGWLRRASPLGHVTVCMATLAFALEPFDASVEAPVEAAWGSFGFGIVVVALYGRYFYQVWKGVLQEGPAHLMAEASVESPAQPQSEGEEEEGERSAASMKIDPERWRAFQQGNCRLSVLGSAMLFSVMHSGNWPAPIALYFLALPLGWLALRTQSLIGPIVMHACFNAVAFVVLLQSSGLM